MDISTQIFDIILINMIPCQSTYTISIKPNLIGIYSNVINCLDNLPIIS